MTDALRRLAAMPVWIVALWLGPIVLAAGIGLALRVALQVGLEHYAVADDGRRIFAIVDVAIDHRAAIGSFATSTIVGTVLGAIAWTIVSGAVIVRLSGESHAWTIAGRWWTSLGGVIVQSLWHLLLRAAILLAVLTTAAATPDFVRWPLLLFIWTACTVALDRTRVAIVLDDASALHPRTAARALLDTFRAWRTLLPAALLALAQLVALAAIPLLAIARLGASTVPLHSRALALLALLLGLLRLAYVIATRPPRSDAR